LLATVPSLQLRASMPVFLDDTTFFMTRYKKIYIEAKFSMPVFYHFGAQDHVHIASLIEILVPR
jgi:hypothetical protein